MVSAIEEIVTSELNGLCQSCIHFEGCLYRRSSERVVIQCELFESGRADPGLGDLEEVPLKGLCLSCRKAPSCHLPKDVSGVWHCEEFE